MKVALLGDVHENLPALEAVLALARNCRYEQEHTHQVTRLACRLFDELRPLHNLGPGERFLLQCGALLHDIGWIQGRKGHHKTAERIIREASELPFAESVRLVVAMIARYHRKALPSEEHEPFARLSEADRRLVRMLAGLLRVADGLDRTHGSVVRDVRVRIPARGPSGLPDAMVVHCEVSGPAGDEVQAALAKGDLLEQACGRRLVIETSPAR